MIKHKALIIAIMLFGAYNFSAFSAECETISNKTVKMTCEMNELSMESEKYRKVYMKLLNLLAPDKTAQYKFIEEDKTWTQTIRRNCPNNISCETSEYVRRTASVNEMISKIQQDKAVEAEAAATASKEKFAKSAAREPSEPVAPVAAQPTFNASPTVPQVTQPASPTTAEPTASPTLAEPTASIPPQATPTTPVPVVVPASSPQVTQEAKPSLPPSQETSSWFGRAWASAKTLISLVFGALFTLAAVATPFVFKNVKT